MKRLASAFAFCVALSSASAFAAVTVRYENKDSKTYTASAVCSGSQKSVEFGSSRTASTTIQGSGPCEVSLNGTKLTLKGGERVVIKDGKLKLD